MMTKLRERTAIVMWFVILAFVFSGLGTLHAWLIPVHRPTETCLNRGGAVVFRQFIRKCEHKHFDMNYTRNRTTVTFEYPQAWKSGLIKIYTVHTEDNLSMLSSYKELVAAPGHPHGKSFHVMISTGSTFSLEHGRPSEFPTPNDQGVLEHVSLLEILNQCPSRFVSQAAASIHVFDQTTVVVPASMVEVDEAHATLGQPASEQTIGGIGTVAGFGAVHFEDVLGFL